MPNAVSKDVRLCLFLSFACEEGSRKKNVQRMLSARITTRLLPTDTAKGWLGTTTVQKTRLLSRV